MYKKGQLIALQAFVPTVIREKLSRLHDDMPPMSPAMTVRVLDAALASLGLPTDALGSIADPDTVLGSASIAQVHRTTLKSTGEVVAVKLQHPDNERLMQSDLANFRLLAEILQRTELPFDLVNSVTELRNQLIREFDFVQEAAAMRHFHHALRSIRGVSVPLPIDGYTSHNLLVMSYVNGTPLSRLQTLIPDPSPRLKRAIGRQVLSRLAKSYGKMILEDGYFHADCMSLSLSND